MKVIHGDNVRVMRAMERNSIALAYLDPPFFTQRVHLATDGRVAFEDRWKSLEHFIETVTEAACAAWDLLLPEGSLVVHVDPKTSHYLKVSLDTRLGRERFASEIIWRYRRWPTSTPNFQRVHDVLLRYVRDRTRCRWNQLYEPVSQKTRDKWKNRKQRAVVAVGPKGKAQRVRSEVTEEVSPGAPLGDVWEIGIIGPASAERTGYPTQKPETLLEKIICATTNENDFVLDPYLGSGTTLAVANRLRRHAVGIDSSDVAIETATRRLKKLTLFFPLDIVCNGNTQHMERDASPQSENGEETNMTTWDESKKRSEQAGPTIFLRLVDDGEKFVGAFLGEPHVRELVWNQKLNKYEDFTEDHRKEGKTPSPRYTLNVCVPDRNPDGSVITPTDKNMKVFEMNNATFKDVVKVREKYGLDKWFFEVERNGKKGDTKTTFSILPETQISAEMQKVIAGLKLHDLAKTKDDGETPQTNMSSHDQTKAGAANGSSNGKTEEATITEEEKQALLVRLKAQPKEKIDAFLAKFEVKQVKMIKTSQLAAALAVLDEYEGKTAAPPAGGDAVDPFA